MKTLKAFIVDDHTDVRRGLKQILEDEGDIEVYETGLAREVLRIINKDNWNVAVVDLDMPDKSGMDLLKDLKKARPSLPILILSIHPTEQFAVRALKAGASGYLNKSSAPDELVKAVRKIASGGKYISADVADRLFFDLLSDSKETPHENLSDREYQVMCLIASGKTLSAIARNLSLSVPTISTYRARILEKTNLKNNAEIIHYAIKQNLID